MNGKIILGVGFQVLQLIILGMFGLTYLFNKINLSQEMYYIIFGGIVIVGFNIASLVAIFSDNEPRRTH
jgi:hypothetical protein